MNFPKVSRTSDNGGPAKHENATRNPQLFLKIVFNVCGEDSGMEKAGSLHFGVGLFFLLYYNVNCQKYTVSLPKTYNIL